MSIAPSANTLETRPKRMPYRIARIVRIAVSVLVAAAMVAGAVIPGDVFARVGLIARSTQLVPAILAVSAGWLLLWLCITLICGRLYCSTVCPLGTLQDIVSRLTRRRQFRYGGRHLFTRVFVILVFAEGAILPYITVIYLLDPYTEFMRIVTAAVAINAASIAAGAAVLAVVTIFAWGRRGRLLCNTICPLGSAMGAVSEIALMRFDIDPDACTHCRRCEDVCKGRCIDSLASTVDNSRCVVCFNCVDACPDNAIFWRRNRHRLRTPLMQRSVAT